MVTAGLVEMLVDGRWEEGGGGGGEDGEEWGGKGFGGLTQEQAWAHMDVGEENVASVGLPRGWVGRALGLCFGLGWIWRGR